MAETQYSPLGNENFCTSMGIKLQKVTKQSIKGPITRYILNTTNTNLINDDYLRRERFGEKDEKKPHKTILLVGETGVGKSTLINTMVNYLLGVRCDDRIWCEIIETKEEQVYFQTEIVTVYDVFIKESPISLTIIDSPGFGRREEKGNLEINEMVHKLCKSTDGVQEIDVVGLVVSSATTRFSEHQLHIFNSVLSLFGNDVEKNIVVFVTKAPTKPRNAIEAIKHSKVPCVKNEEGEPVYFRFNNCHCENFLDKDVIDDYGAVWNLLTKSMKDFLFFLNNSNPVSLNLTEAVLKKHKQLMTLIWNLKDQIKTAELKKNELVQTKAALQELDKQKTDNNFVYEVDEVYKELVPIVSEWWHLNKQATYCTVCKENCHYARHLWTIDYFGWSLMKNGKCTVCSGKCDHSKHEKSNKIYETKTRKVKKMMVDLKPEDYINFIIKLENEITGKDTEKISLVEECYKCVIALDKIALQRVSEFTLQHLDFLIERVKETENAERVQKLEDLKEHAKLKLSIKPFFL